MQIRTIQQGFKAFESKFESIEKNSKHSKIIRTTLNQNSNHSKRIRSIEMEMLTTWKVFEAF